MSVFKVLSYNVWFDQYRMAERMAAIVALIAELKPDVVCFQEICKENYQMLMNNPALRTVAGLVHWAPPDFSHAWYSTAIVSKWPFHNTAPQRMFYPCSQMGRCLLTTQFLHQKEDAPQHPVAVTVATSHLESCDMAPYRAKQLKIVFEQLQSCDNVIFCGDTNIDEIRFKKEAHPLPLGWVDGWPSLHPNDGHTEAGKGYTFSAIINKMVQERDHGASSTQHCARYDRFLVKMDPNQMRLKDMVIIGTSPIGGTTNVFPSDHFGVLAVFEFC